MLLSVESSRVDYKVEDRSILLPFYRRWIVDPTLPLIPRTLNPNSITHAGHAVNLLGTAVLLLAGLDRGWPFFLAVAALQFYLWCDNADGSHARATGQCSPLGEFLDHGLDLLNTVYIGYLTAMALGVSPLWWVGITILIPAAGPVIYWEQAQTGVFRLGMLNQVESLSVLSLALLVRGIFGSAIWEELQVFGISIRLAVLLWCVATIAFGVLHGMYRVAKTSPSNVLPVLVPVVFLSAVQLAAVTEALPSIHAVALTSIGCVHFGMRMLTTRMRGEKPRVDLPMLLGALGLAGLIATRYLGVAIAPNLQHAVVAIALVVYGGQTLVDAHEGATRLVRMTA